MRDSVVAVGISPTFQYTSDITPCTAKKESALARRREFPRVTRSTPHFLAFRGFTFNTTTEPLTTSITVKSKSQSLFLRELFCATSLSNLSHVLAATLTDNCFSTF